MRPSLQEWQTEVRAGRPDQITSVSALAIMLYAGQAADRVLAADMGSSMESDAPETATPASLEPSAVAGDPVDGNNRTAAAALRARLMGKSSASHGAPASERKAVASQKSVSHDALIGFQSQFSPMYSQADAKASPERLPALLPYLILPEMGACILMGISIALTMISRKLKQVPTLPSSTIALPGDYSCIPNSKAIELLYVSAGGYPAFSGHAGQGSAWRFWKGLSWRGPNRRGKESEEATAL